MLPRVELTGLVMPAHLGLELGAAHRRIVGTVGQLAVGVAGVGISDLWGVKGLPEPVDVLVDPAVRATASHLFGPQLAPVSRRRGTTTAASRRRGGRAVTTHGDHDKHIGRGESGSAAAGGAGDRLGIPRRELSASATAEASDAAAKAVGMGFGWECWARFPRGVSPLRACLRRSAC
jgi:hypothetical protein